MPPRLAVPDLLGDRNIDLFFRPHMGLELDTVYRIGTLVAGRNTIGCPHRGMQTAMQAGGGIRAVVSENANAEIICVTPSALGIQFDLPFEVYVTVRNPKPFETLIYRKYGAATNEMMPKLKWDRRTQREFATPPSRILPGEEGISNCIPIPPEMGLSFTLNGHDITDQFTIDSIAGAGEISPEASEVVCFRVSCKVTVPRGQYLRVVPTVATFAWASTENSTHNRLFGVVQGDSLSDVTSCRIYFWQ